MVTRNSLHGAIGCINRILSVDSAEIVFKLNDNIEKVYLRKDKFYHNGRLIPQEDPLYKYIRCGMEVKFSCRVLKQSGKHEFGWIAVMCWRHDQSLGLSVETKLGMVYVLGQVQSLRNRHGVLITRDISGMQHRIYFQASRVYINGKRLPLLKSLLDILVLEDNVFFDAVPCIPEENDEGCKWFATCVFKGSRPDIAEPIPQPIPDNNMTRNVMQIIAETFTNPRTMFLVGRGILMTMLDNDLGIIMGEMQYNIFKEVLVCRKYTFLYQTCLACHEMSRIFVEGDRMKFVAVGAPPGFFVDWIAIQVAVCNEGEYNMPYFNHLRFYMSHNLYPMLKYEPVV